MQEEVTVHQIIAIEASKRDWPIDHVFWYCALINDFRNWLIS
jgi:hypothetical protein